MRDIDTAPGADPGHLLITRAFDAPRSRLWNAWTNAEDFAKWWGPKNFTLHVLKFDLRPGGICHYSMRGPDGGEMWGRFTYREVGAPERLVFTSSFADAEGAIAPNPWLPDWPPKVLNFLTLAEDAGTTRLDLRAMPLDATQSQQAAFAKMRPSMLQGFAGAFDQLAACVAAH